MTQQNNNQVTHITKLTKEILNLLILNPPNKNLIKIQLKFLKFIRNLKYN